MSWKWEVVLLGLFAGYVCLLFVLSRITRLRDTKRQRRKQVARLGDTKDAFLRHFSAQGISPAVSGAVFVFLQDLAYVQNFPLRPDDDLYFAGVDRILELQEVLEEYELGKAR